MKYRAKMCFIAMLCIGHIKAQESAEELARQRLRQPVEELVEEAARFLKSQSIDRACFDFVHNKHWKEPNTKLFLMDEHNRAWFILGEYMLTWRRLKSRATSHSSLIPMAMRKRGQTGGWLSFLWNQELVRLYVRNVSKGNRLYTLGAFLFAEGPNQAVQEQVFIARRLLIHEGLRTTVEQINNPNGQFLRGLYSVTLYDQDGVCLANSYNLACVGSTARDRTDDEGKNVFEGYVQATQSTQFAWTNNVFNGLVEHTFVARLVKKGSHGKKFYILTSSYYPEVNDAFVIDMVGQARDLMNRQGAEKAFEYFAQPGNPFYKARLSLVIYDEHGIVKAQSKYPSVVGMNAYYRKDQAGYPITQTILKTVLEQGKGWVFQYIANAVELVYGERVVLPEGTFVVTVQGYTPLDKKHISAGIVEWLCSRLQIEPALGILRALNRGASVWNQGFKGGGQANIYSDLFIEIYDINGFCVSNGSRLYKMWSKLDKGFKQAIETLKRDKAPGGWFEDYQNRELRRYYAKVCAKSSSEVYYIFVGYVLP